jgi:hypothetical protein
MPPNKINKQYEKTKKQPWNVNIDSDYFKPYKYQQLNKTKDTDEISEHLLINDQ